MRWSRMGGAAAAAIVLAGVALGCGLTETSHEQRVFDLFTPTVLDLDTGQRIDAADAFRAGEVQLWVRSGAPWARSTSGITRRGEVRPTLADCRQVADTAWSAFEAPISAFPPLRYYCVKTTAGAIGWFSLRRPAGSTEALVLEYELDR